MIIANVWTTCVCGREFSIKMCCRNQLNKNKILYSRKVWQGECLVNLLFLSVWRKGLAEKSLVNEYREAKGLLLVWQIADDSPNLSNFPITQ